MDTPTVEQLNSPAYTVISTEKNALPTGEIRTVKIYKGAQPHDYWWCAVSSFGVDILAVEPVQVDGETAYHRRY